MTYRGIGLDRPQGVPIPGENMPLFRAGQLRKRWALCFLLERRVIFLCGASEGRAAATGVLGNLGSRGAAGP